MNFYFFKTFFPFIVLSLIIAPDSFAFSTNACVDCSSAIFTGVTDTHSDQVTIGWFDFNDDANEWELELGLDGFTPSGTTNLAPAITNSYTFTGLLPGIKYQFYIRTICESEESNWAGPFPFRTHFINPSDCQSDLNIRDNNCSTANYFGIEISGYDQVALGTDIFINDINLIIEHGFPSDLEISLLNPTGDEIILSNRNGIATDNYGDPSDLSCENVVSFSMNACKTIIDGPKPYIGSYQPEGNLNEFHNDSTPNGIWLLKLCDVAQGDAGVIKYAEINFSDAICQVPQYLYLDHIQDDNVSINWDYFEACDQLLIEYGEPGFISGEGTSFSVSCQDLSATINGLNPGTGYEVEVQSVCSADNSPLSCRLYFETTCRPVTLEEDFNQQPICEISCGNLCPIAGTWSNNGGDSFDWLVYSGPTPTDFTGPLSDFSGFGNYLYIESFGTECNINLPAGLESNCLLIHANNDGCDMSFKYHMEGIEINRLELEISIDNGMTWTSLWNQIEDQGSMWQEAIIDLTPYHAMVAKLRFTGYGSNGSFGDIAIDDIKFFGSVQASEHSITYYVDEDGDGFGNDANQVQLCYDNPPIGFSGIGGDCDDTNENISPWSLEIPCNLIDENCNGLEDDPVQSNPLTVMLDILDNETCGESFDGQIEIIGMGGSPPYSFLWNNDSTGSVIDSLTAGVYFCTVVDDTGCIAVSDFFEIDTENDITMFITNLVNPDCDGSIEGSITINQSGGMAPYTYFWNNQDTGSTITNLIAGAYWVTIIDANGCTFESEPIMLTEQNPLTITVQSKLNVSCYGGNDGEIHLNINSGSPPYQFEWSNGDSLFFTNGLDVGIYDCTVTDSQGCQGIIQNIVIEQPDELIISLDLVDHNICFGGDKGSIETSIQGGTAPFSFSWSNGGFSDDIFDLETGIYGVTVTDNNFCQSQIDSIEIREPEEIAIIVDSIKNVNCLLSKDGFISTNVSGGIPPYQYFWNYPGSDTSFINSLPVQAYRLTVLDVFACKQILDGIQINHKNVPLDIDIFIDEEIKCNGDSTGSINAISQNGTPPFDFNWSAGQRHVINNHEDNISSLNAGVYDVTVTDNEGCVGITETVELSDPELLIYQLKHLSNLRCFGDKNGSIDIEIEGGTKPYSYTWSNEMTTEDIDGLVAGYYQLTISDEQGCSLITQGFEIREPEELLTLSSSSPAVNNQDNGSATVSPFGGSPSYSYEWDSNANDQVTQTATGLFPGEYFVTISDSRNCTIDTSVVVDNITSSSELDFVRYFNVHPNPAYDEVIISLKLKESKLFKIKLVDLFGREIILENNLNTNIFSTKYTIDYLSNGIYFVVIEMGGQIAIRKLVKHN